MRIAVVDETGGPDWVPAIVGATRPYGSATPHVLFQTGTENANIVVHVRRYSDSQPPALRDYL